MEFDDHAKNWEELGRRDAMWAILTDPKGKDGAWDPEVFFETGRNFIELVAGKVIQAAGEINQDRALDFGCGYGRLTQPLCKYFRSVVGVDIAPSMIAGARSYNRQGDRCQYVLNTRPDLSAWADNSFDCVLSVIVLQHMRPEYIKRYLAEFLRILRPGGVTFFQVATSPKTAEAEVAYPEGADGEPEIQMYAVPRSEVEALMRANGGKVLAAVPDDAAGPHWFSHHFTVQKL